MNDKDRVRQLKSYIEHLVQLRRPWAEAWDSVREVARPMRAWEINSLTPRATQLEDLISPHIVDNTAGRAIRILAAGLQSGLTPPSRSWFSLRIADSELMEYGPVKEWLYLVEQRIYSEFARSNFYPSIHAVYHDLAACCSGCLAMHSRPGEGLRFHDVPIGTFVWGGDAEGRIHTVARHLNMTAGELLRTFGPERLSRATRLAAEKNPHQPVGAVHLVMPRDHSEREPGKLDRLHKPFASYIFEAEGDQLVDEGGFDVFPFLCARWDVIGGELYGRGAGFDSLPDVRMLQAVARDQSMAIRMAVTPPMKIPASLKGQPLYLIPGAKNYVSEAAYERVGPLYEVRADIAAASAKIADLRRAILDGYFNDLFLTLQNADKRMTAYEVAERNSEKLLMLGPVIERHQTDILDPCISAAFARLNDEGALPEPPDELEGRSLHIEFISVLAQAQRLSQAGATRNLLNDVAGISQLNPEVLDKLDFDQVVDELAAVEGVPPKIVRPDAQVQEIRQARAEAEAAAAQMQELQAMSDQALKEMEALGGQGNGAAALGELMQGLAPEEPGPEPDEQGGSDEQK